MDPFQTLGRDRAVDACDDYGAKNTPLGRVSRGVCHRLPGMLKLLVWLGAIGAAAYGLWYLAGRPQYRLRLRGLREFAAAVLSVVMLAAAVLAAHWLGVFSLPLVVLAFVPFGVAIRWLLTETRASRQGRGADRSAASGGRWAGLALPLLVLMAVGLAVLGVFVGTLIGPH